MLRKRIERLEFVKRRRDVMLVCGSPDDAGGAEGAIARHIEAHPADSGAAFLVIFTGVPEQMDGAP